METQVATEKSRVISKAPLARALRHLASRQHPPGHWEAEMVWNTMLLSQVVLTHRMVNRPLAPETVKQIIKHYEVAQRPDGSWPMHGEGDGYVYLTALGYVALRVRGL